jgi:peptidyl-prolyl cis-trans isomerase D
MLTSLRKQAKSWIFKVLFVVLIAAFAVWGIGDVFRTQQVSEPIIRIGDEYVYTPADFDRELRLAVQRLSQIQGMQITPALFAQLGGAERLVDQAENRGLLQVYSSDLGFQIPVAAVVQYIEADPNLAGTGGRFDRARFEYFLRQTGQSEEQYVANEQTQLRASYVLSAVTGPLAAPANLVRSVYSHDAEMRSADTVLVPTASITDITAPDDATLTAWHQAEAARYQAPEYRNGQLVQMTPSDFIQDVAVSEEEIAAEYQARLAELSTPEIRNVDQVVVQDPAVADKVIAAVKGGKPFAEAVREATQGEPVALGQVTKERLPADIADAVFALPAGTVSDVLKSPFGLHVVFVSAVTPATTRPLAEVEGELRNALAIGRASDAMESVRVQLEDELAGGLSLSDAAQKLNLKLETFAAIDAAGQGRDGVNLGMSPEAVALIFDTQIGDSGYVTPLNDGSYAVAQVNEIIPPALKPLADVRDQAIADWTAAQQAARARTLAEEIAAKVKAGADLKAEAEARGLTVKTSKPFLRGVGDTENGINGMLASGIFKLKAGEVTIGESAEGTVVARLTNIQAADPAAQAEAMQEAAARQSQALGGDLRQAFLQALKAELPVERDDTLWQSAIEITNEP